jgi:hypothetical protein
MKFQLSRFTALSTIMLGAILLPVRAQNQSDASPDEYKVYEAVFGLMDRIPKEDPHVTVFSVTLNSKCGEDAYTGLLANGCTFLWMKPDTANNVKQLLRQEWTDMENATWSDFEMENAASVHLHEPISTPGKHKLVGPGDDRSKDWESPDLTIFLSRVGFNQKRTQAVVYVLIFSYVDQVATTGDYFLFRKDKTGQWKPSGRVTYFTKDKE